MARADSPSKAEAPAKSKALGKLIPIVIAALVAAAAAGAGVFFMVGHKSGGDAAAAEKKQADAPKDFSNKPAQYLTLTPSFVVNLEDDQAMRYLQVDIDVMTRDPGALDPIKANMPRIRNTLMLLFTQQHYQEIVTREGKEKLQKQALEAVQKVMTEEVGKPCIEALYFTNFVMQ